MAANYKIYTIDSPMVPPIDGMKVAASSAASARKKAVRQKIREINVLMAQDILKCPFGDISSGRQKLINRKAVAVIRSNGLKRFTMQQAWAIAMPDKEAEKIRREFKHAVRRAMIANLRRNRGEATDSADSQGYYSRHPEMMLKAECRRS